MKTQIYSGGDGVAMPDADDDNVGPLALGSPILYGQTLVGTLWWGVTLSIFVAMLIGVSAPWWLLLVAGGELCETPIHSLPS